MVISLLNGSTLNTTVAPFDVAEFQVVNNDPTDKDFVDLNNNGVYDVGIDIPANDVNGDGLFFGDVMDTVANVRGTYDAGVVTFVPFDGDIFAGTPNDVPVPIDPSMSIICN